MPDEAPYAILWRQRWLIAAIVAVFGVAAALVSTSLTKIYSATNTLLVTVAANEQSFDSVQAAQAFTRSYADISASPNIARVVARRLGDGADEQALRKAVTVQAVPQTQLMKITAEDASPARAKRIADTYAAVAADYVRRDLAPHTQASLTPADAASLPERPVRPNMPLYVLIACLVGLAAACALALCRDRLDGRLRVAEDVESAVAGDLPILGRIPLRGGSEGSVASFAEAHRLLRTNLESLRGSGPLRSIAVTSARDGEGKSTVAAQLARAHAEVGVRVLIVEADFRFPGIQSELGRAEGEPPSGGLGDYLDGLASLDEIIRPAAHYGVAVVSAGAAPTSGSALLESSRAREAVPAFLERADLLLVDCPPVNAGADASIITGKVDGVIVVVDLKSSTDRSVSAALRQLRAVRSSVLGLVLNRDREAQTNGHNGHHVAPSGPPLVPRPAPRRADTAPRRADTAIGPAHSGHRMRESRDPRDVVD
jgi:tyrosine-protein kinase